MRAFGYDAAQLLRVTDCIRDENLKTVRLCERDGEAFREAGLADLLTSNWELAQLYPVLRSHPTQRRLSEIAGRLFEFEAGLDEARLLLQFYSEKLFIERFRLEHEHPQLFEEIHESEGRIRRDLCRAAEKSISLNEPFRKIVNRFSRASLFEVAKQWDLAGRRKSEMVEEIAQNLSEQADTTISLLHSREREALSALLARGGWMPNGEFAERYGTDEDDKWVWNGTLPLPFSVGSATFCWRQLGCIPRWEESYWYPPTCGLPSSRFSARGFNPVGQNSRWPNRRRWSATRCGRTAGVAETFPGGSAGRIRFRPLGGASTRFSGGCDARGQCRRSQYTIMAKFPKKYLPK